jgi:hypothetical protein
LTQKRQENNTISKFRRWQQAPLWVPAFQILCREGAPREFQLPMKKKASITLAKATDELSSIAPPLAETI